MIKLILSQARPQAGTGIPRRKASRLSIAPGRSAYRKVAHHACTLSLTFAFCSPTIVSASRGQWFVIMSLPIASTHTAQHAAPTPWILPDRAFTILYGCPEMPRLSHYFLPRILLNQGGVLYLDGANQISPLLIARFARERGLDPSAFNALIRVSRAFTCFQLTELIRRVPKVLGAFAADVLIVTALPDLFFDEDVRDREARASFEHALEGLQEIAMLPISIAVFSDATSFKTKRRDFFQQLCNQARQVLRVEARSDSELCFSCEKTAPLLSQ
jgi:hypothetical protein